MKKMVITDPRQTHQPIELLKVDKSIVVVVDMVEHRIHHVVGKGHLADGCGQEITPKL